MPRFLPLSDVSCRQLGTRHLEQDMKFLVHLTKYLGQIQDSSLSYGKCHAVALRVELNQDESAGTTN
jgi:hypothetical protein